MESQTLRKRVRFSIQSLIDFDVQSTLPRTWKDELKSIGIKGETQRHIRNGIFGFVEDEVYHEGLLNAKDDQSFDAVLACLEPEWNKKGQELLPERNDPKFFIWTSKKAARIKGSLTAGVRLKAGP